MRPVDSCDQQRRHQRPLKRVGVGSDARLAIGTVAQLEVLRADGKSHGALLYRDVGY